MARPRRRISLTCGRNMRTVPSDQRRVLNVSIVARSPHFGSGWMQRVAGNWQVAPILTASTGTYSTVTQGGADTSLVGNSRPNLVAGAVEKLGNPTIRKWFNTSAYSNVTAQHSGTSAGARF